MSAHGTLVIVAARQSGAMSNDLLERWTPQTGLFVKVVVYDAVIVGGGVAGMVLAERLSENASYTVLLLEAGPDPTGDQTVSTPAFARRLWGTQFSWNFTSLPQAALGGVAPVIHQGHTFGGGSAINVMAYCRGAASVYDEWAELAGNDAFRWDNIYPHFRESAQLFVPENLSYTQVIDRSGFSANGPLMVSYERPDQVNQLGPTFLDAFANDAIQPAQDADLTTGVGIGLVRGGPHAIRESNGTRHYSWPAYGYRAVGRPNAKLLHSSRATKILFDKTDAKKDPRAVGVEYVSTVDNSTHIVSAKEVIVSAGAIGSPWLLMLSGVGPKAHLESVGVPVVADSPELGSNFYDHHIVPMMFVASPDILTPAAYSNATFLAELELEYQANGTGPLSAPGTSAFVTERVPDAVLLELERQQPGLNLSHFLNLPSDRPHLAYQGTTGAFLPAPAGANVASPFVALVQPEGSGTVRLGAATWDGAAQPLLGSAYFSTPGDQAVILHGYQRLLNLTRGPAFAAINTGELYPGTNVTSDGDVWAAVQKAAQTFHHVIGTCSLGKVLDGEFRVKGVRGLRVVDTSAMPRLPTCHTQAPTYALAELAAAMIREEWED
ncbi:alcohol oxidase [Thozetella sp. PMI_491]|nr:alcohol oxidase [Thozetella sp. PMI_491]